MHERPVRPLYAWLRLVLAAFVLAVYSSLALATGIARADDGPSASNGDPGAKGATTSQQTGAKPSGPAEAKPPGPTEASPNVAPTGTKHADPTEKPAESTLSGPSKEDPAPTTTLPPVDVSHGSKRSAQLSSVAASVDVTPTATIAATVHTLAPSVEFRPATAAVATVPPAVTTPAATAPSVVTPAPAPRVIQPQPGLQLPGLVADVGTVTVSAVHTVATVAAQAFGPHDFLGVPYLLATTVANAAAAVGRTLVGAPLSEPDGRFPVDYGLLDGLAFVNPTTPPAGADDPSIKVTPEHPLPIILLNGTTATQGTNWSVGAPVLANAGYKVYTFNYGNTTGDPNFPIQATADIRQSAQELSAEVNRVLAATGAKKVILIGHSQGGGILPEYYLNDLGGAAKVSQLIGIAPSNHGTDLDGLIALQSLPILGALAVGIANAIGPALYQQAVDSPFQQEVYGNGDTRPGVLYTTITSINDEVVTPYTQQALTGPGVTNIVLQDRYPGVVLGHANIITSPQAFALVLEALASNPAANPLAGQYTVAA